MKKEVAKEISSLELAVIFFYPLLVSLSIPETSIQARVERKL